MSFNMSYYKHRFLFACVGGWSVLVLYRRATVRTRLCCALAWSTPALRI